uniref:Uncharacterized protein n=1 Tax=Triticum urartu TaxID=4572 RepID=A0A8R7QVA3_TRIUA
LLTDRRPSCQGEGAGCSLRRWRRLSPCQLEPLEQTRLPLHLLSASCQHGPVVAGLLRLEGVFIFKLLSALVLLDLCL